MKPIHCFLLVIFMTCVACQSTPDFPQLPRVFTAKLSIMSGNSVLSSGLYTYDSIKHRTRFDYHSMGKQMASLKLYSSQISTQYDVVFSKKGKHERCETKHAMDHTVYPLVVPRFATFVGRERWGVKKVYNWAVDLGVVKMNYFVTSEMSQNGKVVSELKRFTFNYTLDTKYNADWLFESIVPLNATENSLFQEWNCPTVQIPNPTVAIRGFVRDSYTMKGIPNMKVTIRYPLVDYPDVDEQDPWYEQQVTTDSLGIYTFDKIPHGRIVTLKLNDAENTRGFNLLDKTLVANGDLQPDSISDFNIVQPDWEMMGSWRIVLSWNSTVDLDGSYDVKPTFRTDVTNGFGPEVMTVKQRNENQKLEGDFYAVSVFGSDVAVGKTGACAVIFDHKGKAMAVGKIPEWRVGKVLVFKFDAFGVITVLV